MPFPGPNIEVNGYTAQSVLPGAGRNTVPLQLTLANLTATDMILPMTYKGRLVALDFSVLAKVTTAGKAATLTPKVRSAGVTTNMTGGVVSLTSALATPEGAIINGTPITALNAFRPGDFVVVTVSGLTAFSEGTGFLLLTLVNDDTLGTIERVGMMFASAG